MEELIKQLEILQHKCIGLFNNSYTNELEMVIEEKEGLLVTITIGTLGGISENNTSISNGLFKRFPDNKSLYEMKDDPFALNDFCKLFGK